MRKLCAALVAWFEAYLTRWRRVLNRLIGPLRTAARARYRKLELREKVVLALGGGLFAAFLIYDLVFVPLREARSDLDSEAARRRHELVAVARMVQEYKTLEREVVAAQNRALAAGKDFALFSVLEARLSQSLGRDKITSISPSDKKLGGELIEHRVDLKLENLSLSQVVDALYRIEHLSPPVVVSELRIKKRPNNPHSFDVDLSCFAVGKAS
jgi:hypothetical protein